MIKNEIILGLETMKKLCASLGNPQNSIKAIHIAGTNGKGSTAAFINSVLIENKFKVGRYTSPAVFDYREKFQINNKYITEEKLNFYTQSIKKTAENTGCSPTIFELETAVAFLWFSDEKCDYIILETGMGGRLDATNICQSTVLSVITSISIDHTKFLGNTIEKITSEKAGIIKKNSKAVILKQNEAVMKILRNKCHEENCEIIEADKNEISHITLTENGQKFNYGTAIGIEIPLIGKYQCENCITAIECCRALGISEEIILKGISKASWHGRFERIRKTPEIIIDGAHNEDGASRLIETIRFCFPDRKIIYITGVFADKNYEKIAELTAPSAEYIFTVTPPSERGLSAEKYADCIMRYNKNAFPAKSILAALNKSISLADKNTVIICFGSLSFLKKIKEYNNEIQ